MSEHHIRVHWQRITIEKSYSRNHTWSIDASSIIPASASSSVVPPPYSEDGRIDPETGFVGSISSCHMLWFLAIAHERGYVVAQYLDEATGVLSKDETGRLSITQVQLRPQTKFDGLKPTAEELDSLHVQAHKLCFIANSVKSSIHITPILEVSNV
jgi:organic hydroperoxide reductase OsmC/OhrA